MARLRKGSSVLETARQRLAGLKAINPAPDFGSSLSAESYESEIEEFSSALAEYNGQLAVLDDMQNALLVKEAALRDKNKRFLSAAEAHYGSDSSEYELVGGTRSSERRRTPRKPTRKGGANT